MTMIFKKLFAAALFLTAPGALALAPSPPNGAAGNETSEHQAAKEKPSRICRKIVPTGTMLARSFCLTAAEWKQFDAQNQDNLGRNRTTMAKPLPAAD